MAGTYACPALAHDDVAGTYQLAVEQLDSQTLGVAVSTVPGASSRLLMGH
jgi:hypothetical protein